MRKQFRDEVDSQGRHSRGNLLGLPPVLYGQTAFGRYSGTRGAVPQEIREGHRGEVSRGASWTSEPPPRRRLFRIPLWSCMVEASFAVYYRRATQLADAMKLCRDDLPAYASAAALLAVHSSISYGDAVLIGLGGTRPRGENHREAVTALKRACTRAKIDQQGITHFQSLVSVKTDISYGEKQVDDERVAKLCITSERFQVWAERILRKREGR